MDKQLAQGQLEVRGPAEYIYIMTDEHQEAPQPGNMTIKKISKTRRV